MRKAVVRPAAARRTSIARRGHLPLRLRHGQARESGEPEKPAFYPGLGEFRLNSVYLVLDCRVPRGTPRYLRSERFSAGLPGCSCQERRQAGSRVRRKAAKAGKARREVRSFGTTRWCSRLRRRENKKPVTLFGVTGFLKWWLSPESNRGHEDFQSSALPTELPSHWRKAEQTGRGGVRQREFWRKSATGFRRRAKEERKETWGNHGGTEGTEKEWAEGAEVGGGWPQGGAGDAKQEGARWVRSFARFENFCGEIGMAAKRRRRRRKGGRAGAATRSCSRLRAGRAGYLAVGRRVNSTVLICPGNVCGEA